MRIEHRVNERGDVFYVMTLDSGVTIELNKWAYDDDVMLLVTQTYDNITTSITNNELDQLANVINALRVEVINLARAHPMQAPCHDTP
jgi:hypothetical protein